VLVFVLVLPKRKDGDFRDDEEAQRYNWTVYRVPIFQFLEGRPTEGAITVIHSGHFSGEWAARDPPWYWLVTDLRDWRGGVRGKYEMWWITTDLIIGGHLALSRKIR
jgi:hypothetical protein